MSQTVDSGAWGEGNGSDCWWVLSFSVGQSKMGLWGWLYNCGNVPKTIEPCT